MLIGTIALCLFHNWLVLSIHINSFEKSSKFSLSNCMEILFLFSFFSLVDNGNGYQCIISQGDKTSYRWRWLCQRLCCMFIPSFTYIYSLLSLSLLVLYLNLILAFRFVSEFCFKTSAWSGSATWEKGKKIYIYAFAFALSFLIIEFI
jgi:hypothetical protein